MMNQIKRFFKEEEGQGMTEYGLILGLVALAAVGALFLVGDKIVDMFNDVVEKFTNPSGETSGN